MVALYVCTRSRNLFDFIFVLSIRQNSKTIEITRFVLMHFSAILYAFFVRVCFHLCYVVVYGGVRLFLWGNDNFIVVCVRHKIIGKIIKEKVKY